MQIHAECSPLLIVNIMIESIRRLDVVNRGLSGYNTSNAVSVLPKIFAPPVPGGPKIEYLLVWFGANDAAITLSVDNQHVPLDQYRANLASIIQHPIIAAHKARILLITPPPIDEVRIDELDRAKGHKEATRKSKISAQYAQVAREVAAAVPNVILIDLEKAMLDVASSKTPGFDASGPRLGDLAGGQRGYLEHLLPDGLHLSGESYKILWDLVESHITPGWDNLGELERYKLYALPDWRRAPWLGQ
jgi:lysophospholipase L1-like esterase